MFTFYFDIYILCKFINIENKVIVKKKAEILSWAESIDARVHVFCNFLPNFESFQRWDLFGRFRWESQTFWKFSSSGGSFWRWCWFSLLVLLALYLFLFNIFQKYILWALTFAIKSLIKFWSPTWVLFGLGHHAEGG